jgi:DNA-binding XRE family transcriptional regulator
VKDFVDIDVLVEQEERDPGLAASVAVGRKLVADAFYTCGAATLASYRMQKGWSQKRLAQEASTSQSYIAGIESGNIDPQIRTARKIASALGITIEVLDAALYLCRK